MNPKKKPTFRKLGATYLKRLGTNWRRTKGRHSKLRQHHEARGFLVNPGYGSPLELRYLHPSGFKDVLVHSLKDLEKIDSKAEAIRIASSVGNKLRLQIQKKAEELKIKILNPKKIEEKKKIKEEKK